MSVELTPPRWARRAAALAILGMVLLATHSALVTPLTEKVHQRDEAIATMRSALARFQDAARGIPAAEARLAALELQRRNGGGYLLAENEAQAAAAVQSRIKSAVAAAGGELRSVEILQPESGGSGMPKLVARARIAVDLVGLQQVLQALDETGPVLFIEALDIARADRFDRGARREDRLQVEITVYGHIRRAA